MSAPNYTGKSGVARVWHGREGDGVFVRGGTGRLVPNLRKHGAKWHPELRGWVMPLSVWQSVKLVYSDPVEDLLWADFVLEEWQGREPVVQGPRVADRRNVSRSTGGMWPGYQRAAR